MGFSKCCDDTFLPFLLSYLAQKLGDSSLFCRYKDTSRTSFKSSTRLECMMQDYPKTLPPSARVGFTVSFIRLCLHILIPSHCQIHFFISLLINIFITWYFWVLFSYSLNMSILLCLYIGF